MKNKYSTNGSDDKAVQVLPEDEDEDEEDKLNNVVEVVDDDQDDEEETSLDLSSDGEEWEQVKQEFLRFLPKYGAVWSSMHYTEQQKHASQQQRSNRSSNCCQCGCTARRGNTFLVATPRDGDARDEEQVLVSTTLKDAYLETYIISNDYERENDIDISAVAYEEKKEVVIYDHDNNENEGVDYDWDERASSEVDQLDENLDAAERNIGECHVDYRGADDDYNEDSNDEGEGSSCSSSSSGDSTIVRFDHISFDPSPTGADDGAALPNKTCFPFVDPTTNNNNNCMEEPNMESPKEQKVDTVLHSVTAAVMSSPPPPPCSSRTTSAGTPQNQDSEESAATTTTLDLLINTPNVTLRSRRRRDLLGDDYDGDNNRNDSDRGTRTAPATTTTDIPQATALLQNLTLSSALYDMASVDVVEMMLLRQLHHERVDFDAAIDSYNNNNNTILGAIKSNQYEELVTKETSTDQVPSIIFAMLDAPAPSPLEDPSTATNTSPQSTSSTTIAFPDALPYFDGPPDAVTAAQHSVDLMSTNPKHEREVKGSSPTMTPLPFSPALATQEKARQQQQDCEIQDSDYEDDDDEQEGEEIQLPRPPQVHNKKDKSSHRLRRVVDDSSNSSGVSGEDEGDQGHRRQDSTTLKDVDDLVYQTRKIRIASLSSDEGERDPDDDCFNESSSVEPKSSAVGTSGSLAETFSQAGMDASQEPTSNDSDKNRASISAGANNKKRQPLVVELLDDTGSSDGNDEGDNYLRSDGTRKATLSIANKHTKKLAYECLSPVNMCDRSDSESESNAMGSGGRDPDSEVDRLPFSRKTLGKRGKKLAAAANRTGTNHASRDASKKSRRFVLGSSSISSSNSSGNSEEEESITRIDEEEADDESAVVDVPSTNKKAAARQLLQPKSSALSKRAFIRQRETLSQQLFLEYDRVAFDGALSAGNVCTVAWSNRLLTTAGMTRLKRTPTGQEGKYHRTAVIELSCKVLDNEHRVKSTLMHEMCHAAAWIVDGNSQPPHGKIFKKWAKQAMKRFPSMQVTTTHNYEIEYKYAWMCQNTKECGAIFQRHSRSIDVKRHVCGKCKGRLVEIEKLSAGATSLKSGGSLILKEKSTAAPSAYIRFIQEHSREVRRQLEDVENRSASQQPKNTDCKKTSVSQKDVLKECARLWKLQSQSSSNAQSPSKST